MHTSPKRIAVVILNWNGRNFLEKFLPDVVRFSSEEAEVIIADNASTDDSVSFLEKNHPSLRIIRLEENKGYTGGYNAALKQIDCEYYVLLNSDVSVTKNWLTPLLALMDRENKCAACQPKILSFARPDEFEYAGAGGGYIDRFGYPFCRGRIFLELEKDKGQYNDSREVFWATGACMFVRAAAFHELGGLDEDFFAHMEEIDLCWRMHRAGYSVWYCGSSVVYHVGGGTLPKNNPRKTYFNFRNNLFMLYKNSSPGTFAFTLIIRTLLDFVAAITFLFGSGTKDFYAVLRAHRDFYRGKSRYANRPKMRFLSDNQYINMIYKGSIVWAFYILRIRIFPDLKFFRKEGKRSSPDL